MEKDNPIYAHYTPAVGNLIRLVATLAANLDPRAGIQQRLANVIVAELGDLINGSDPYLIPFRETLASTAGRLCTGGPAGPGMLDSSAALYELTRAIYSIPQAPPPPAHCFVNRRLSSPATQLYIPSRAYKNSIDGGGRISDNYHLQRKGNQYSPQANATFLRSGGLPVSTSRPNLAHPPPNYPPSSPQRHSESHSSPPQRIHHRTLPVEVISLIVEFVQPANYRQRLLQNIALACVCRSFYISVRPRLLAEIHITSAHQLPRLDTLFKREPERIPLVTFLTIDLELDSLKWKDKGPWFGASFQSVVKHLCKVKNVSLSFKRGSGVISDEDSGDVVTELSQATGGSRMIFEQFRQSIEMRLYFPLSAKDAYRVIQSPEGELRRLYINPMGDGIRDGNDGYVFSAHHPYEVLAVPHLILTARQLLSILPTQNSTLHHLDFSFQLPLADEESIMDIAQLFKHLSPSLTRLSINIEPRGTLPASPSAGQETSISPWISPWQALCAGISTCENLQNLRIGGAAATDIKFLVSAFSKLPALSILTLQPLFDDDGVQISLCYELEQELVKDGAGQGESTGSSFERLESLVVHIPTEGERDRVYSSRQLYEICSVRNIALGVVDRGRGSA